MRLVVIFACIFAIGLPSMAEEEPPPNLILLYGPLAKPIWKSYHKDRKLNLDLFIRDHLKLGSIHDGDQEEFLAWCLIQIEEDPKPVLDELLKSEKPEEVGFALYTIWSLGDPRYHKNVEELTRSTMELPFWNLTSVASLASSVRGSFEGKANQIQNIDTPNVIVKKISSNLANWYIEALETVGK